MKLQKYGQKPVRTLAGFCFRSLNWGVHILFDGASPVEMGETGIVGPPQLPAVLLSQHNPLPPAHK